MEWVNKNGYWLARGNIGKFYIQKKGIYYFATYLSNEKYFQLPKNTDLSLVKKMCEDNYYWEDEVKDVTIDRAPILIDDDAFPL